MKRSILKMGIGAAAWVFMFVVSSGAAHAATLYFYPQQVSLVPGAEALVDIRIDTGGEAINAVELEGALSGVVATLRNIDNSGSDLDIFVERPNVKGRSGFRLVGGVPASLTGDHVLARLALRGELVGKSTLSFTPDKVRVLLADGTGAAAAVKFMDATVTVEPKSKDYLLVSSDSHPDQNQWYATSVAHVRFSFDATAAYSYVVSRDPLENPDAVADKPDGVAQWDGGVKLEGLPEGVLYFAVQKVGSNSVSRYRLMNDMSKPRWLEVKWNAGTSETEGRPFLTFLADDAISGVEYYEMRVDGAEPVSVTSPQPLPDEYSVLSIRAYDRAGNFIEEYIPGPQKDFSLWVWGLVLFVLLVWVSGIIDTGKQKR